MYDCALLVIQVVPRTAVSILCISDTKFLPLLLFFFSPSGTPGSSCPHGVQQPCAVASNTICLPPPACATGTNWSHTGRVPCNECSTTASCTDGIKSLCSPTSNVLCHTACVNGATWSVAGVAPCAPCKQEAACTLGVKQPCTRSADTKCGETQKPTLLPATVNPGMLVL